MQFETDFIFQTNTYSWLSNCPFYQLWCSLYNNIVSSYVKVSANLLFLMIIRKPIPPAILSFLISVLWGFFLFSSFSSFSSSSCPTSLSVAMVKWTASWGAKALFAFVVYRPLRRELMAGSGAEVVEEHSSIGHSPWLVQVFCSYTSCPPAWSHSNQENAAHYFHRPIRFRQFLKWGSLLPDKSARSSWQK